MSARTFDDRPATREKTPILVGLVGPSGTGKTYSALRLAAGFQRVSGGDTYFIDTEGRRALHYAEKFNFRHVAFGAPFGPLDYLDAIRHCIDKGATTIIVDSMSHEHEGPGGVLEMHTIEHQRLGGREGTKMLAWAKPKQERRRLINSILQMSCNFIFCFRAKEKLKLERGKDPVALGFMPLAGEEFVYEMTLKCLLLPGACGVPTWKPAEVGEKAMVKLPEQFIETFAAAPQLTEDIGQQLATWAAGKPAARIENADELVDLFNRCSDAATHRSLEDVRRLAWPTSNKADKTRIKAASDQSAARIDAAMRNLETAIAADMPAPLEAVP
jgi:ABC-type dipeptide/oligopeptide/nickel transport system ATPase subunit